jgi:hypothetical protein
MSCLQKSLPRTIVAVLVQQFYFDVVTKLFTSLYAASWLDTGKSGTLMLKICLFLHVRMDQLSVDIFSIIGA